MNPLVVRENVLANAANIVALAEASSHLFTAHRSGRQNAKTGLADFDLERDTEDEGADRYAVLQGPDMPKGLLLEIMRGLRESGSKVRRGYVQLCRYERGDYVLPHRDAHAQGIYVLTTSHADGLVIENEGGGFTRLVDRAGTMVIHDPRALHWVDPVKDGVRYSLVTIPPFHGDVPPSTNTRSQR